MVRRLVYTLAKTAVLGQSIEHVGVDLPELRLVVQNEFGQVDFEPRATGDRAGLDARITEALVGLDPHKQARRAADEAQRHHENDPFLFRHAVLTFSGSTASAGRSRSQLPNHITPS